MPNSTTQRVGSFGDLAVFGFYPNKQLTTGEGGAVLAHSLAHAERLRSLRNQGRGPQRQVFVDGVESRGPQRQVFVDGVEGTIPSAVPPDSDWLHHPDIGFNYRLSEIACAIGRVQLSRIGEILALRRTVAERYHALLSNIAGLELPPLTLPASTISWFVYVVRLPEDADRAHIQAQLAERAIATSNYFAPIHQQPAWLKYSAQNPPFLPVTNSIGPRTLALPFFNRITESQQRQVSTALRAAISRQK